VGKIIDPSSLRPALHGRGVVLAVEPSGIGLVLIAYSRGTGVLGGVIQTYYSSPGASLESLRDLLIQGDWILAHGARAAREAIVPLIPDVERRPWVCSQGIIEESSQVQELGAILWDEGLAKDPLVPGALGLALGLVHVLGQGNPQKLTQALRRAGIVATSPETTIQ
jgi:hypothetical protein